VSAAYETAMMADGEVPNATPDERPAWWQSGGALVLWFVLHSISIFPKNTLEVMAGGPLVPLMPPLVGAAYNLIVAAAFIWWFALRSGPEAPYRRATFRLRAIPPSLIARLPLVAVPLVATVFLSLIVVPRFIPFPPPKADPLEAYLRLPHALFAVLALVSVLVPLCEEFLFRGWLQTRLERRMSATAAIMVTALIFGGAHFQLFGFPIRVVFGLTAGYLAWSTRSIWPGVVLHGIYNMVLIVGGSSTPGMDEAVLTRWAHTTSIFLPAVAGFAVSAMLLVVGLRSVARAAVDGPNGGTIP
jgi:membrane protease YdiL (CAAX protease family)